MYPRLARRVFTTDFWNVQHSIWRGAPDKVRSLSADIFLDNALHLRQTQHSIFVFRKTSFGVLCKLSEMSHMPIITSLILRFCVNCIKQH